MSRDHSEDLKALLQQVSELRQLGRFQEAMALATRARDLAIQHFGPNHPSVATSLNELALLYLAMGDDDAALPLSRQAMEICRTALGESHPLFGASLNNLAELYRDMGDHAAALPLSRQAMEICRTALGEGHPDFAASLNNLALLYQMTGDHAAALPLCRRAMEIWRTALGEGHPHFATSLNSLAGLYAATGRASEALPLMQQAASIGDRMTGQLLAIGSDRQRMAYLRTISGDLYLFLSLVQQHLIDSPAAIRSALDLVLRRKAIAAEAMAAQRDAVLGGKYPALEPALRELAALRMQVARKTLAGPGPEGLESHVRQLGEWNARRERLETDLARQIPEMNLERTLRADEPGADAARCRPPRRGPESARGSLPGRVRRFPRL
jgi:tetratricopeptide (TPR) repeat protein